LGSSFSWWIQTSLGMVSVSSWVAPGSIVSDCTVIGSAVSTACGPVGLAAGTAWLNQVRSATANWESCAGWSPLLVAVTVSVTCLLAASYTALPLPACRLTNGAGRSTLGGANWMICWGILVGKLASW